MEKREPVWELAHKYGEGCRVYIDKSSLIVNGDIARANIRHYSVPPGTDRRNQRPVRGVVFDKEFDLERGQTRYYSITFIYMDGSVADPLPMEPQWTEADDGSLAELNYLRSLVRPSGRV